MITLCQHCFIPLPPFHFEGEDLNTSPHFFRLGILCVESNLHAAGSEAEQPHPHVHAHAHAWILNTVLTQVYLYIHVQRANHTATLS